MILYLFLVAIEPVWVEPRATRSCAIHTFGFAPQSILMNTEPPIEPSEDERALKPTEAEVKATVSFCAEIGGSRASLEASLLQFVGHRIATEFIHPNQDSSCTVRLMLTLVERVSSFAALDSGARQTEQAA